MTYEKIDLIDYIDVVPSGIEKFEGVKSYVSTGSLQNGKIIDRQEVTYESRPSRANMEAISGDVLFAKMKDTEKVLIVNPKNSKNIYSTGFSILRIKDKTKFIPEYIYYWLRSNDFQRMKNKECTGATQKALNDRKLKKFKIPKPSLETQKKIVKILEKAEKLIEMREEADELTGQLLKSVFLDMFIKKSERVPLNKLISVIIDYRGKTPPFSSQGIRCISAANVSKGKLKFNVEKKVSKETYDVWTTRGFPKGGDIILTTEAPVGEVAVYPNDETFLLTRRVISIRPNNDLVKTHYLLNFFLYGDFRNQLTSMIRGSTVPRILKPDLLSVNVPLAPKELQDEFDLVSDSLSKIISNQSNSKKNLVGLFESLLQKAFKGEIIC